MVNLNLILRGLGKPLGRAGGRGAAAKHRREKENQQRTVIQDTLKIGQKYSIIPQAQERVRE